MFVKNKEQTTKLPIENPNSVTKKQESFNAVDQARYDFDESKAEKRSKSNLDRLKLELSADIVIAYAVENYGILSNYFSVTGDNKISDSRIRAKPRTVIDFMTKTCNLRISEAIPVLEALYQQQLQMKQDAPSTRHPKIDQQDPNPQERSGNNHLDTDGPSL